MELLSARQAAKKIGMSYAAFRQSALRGLVESVQVDGRIVGFTLDSVLRFKSRKRNPGRPPKAESVQK